MLWENIRERKSNVNKILTGFADDLLDCSKGYISLGIHFEEVSV